MKACALLVAFLAGCGTLVCKPGTMLLTIEYGAFASADQVDVTVGYRGGAMKTTTVEHAVGAAIGSVEIDFPGDYVADSEFVVSVTALRAGDVIANGNELYVLSSTCSAELISLGVSNDASMAEDAEP